MINYTKWTRQAFFNKIARHLLTQCKRSKNIEMMDNDGCRCAMGCLIAKKDYFRKNGKWDYKDFPYGIYTTNKYQIMDALRLLHDYGPKPSRWPSRLRKIACQLRLEIPQFLKDA